MIFFLIGMPGSGKSTLGQKAAKALGYDFYDLDTLIEQNLARPIDALFTEKGEGYFRQKEKEALYSIHCQSHCLVATGGGTPCFLDNMDYMLQTGHCIFLETPLEVLATRIYISSQQRPMFATYQTKEQVLISIRSLYEQRKVFYAQAPYHLLTGISVKEDTKKLIELLKSFNEKD